MSGKNVLVTGGAGYVASHVVLSLLEAGYEVTVVDDLSTGSRNLLPADCRFLEGNIGDADFLANALEPDKFFAVLHFAGSTIVEESIRQPLDYYANNVANSLSLLEACRCAGIPKLIFSSTAAVYGEPSRSPVDETAEPRPINPYGRSKLLVERMIQDLAATAPDFHYGILRYFNVAGADPEGRSGQSGAAATHLIKSACEAVVGNRDGIEIFGTDYPTEDGTCIRDYIHVSDLASVHVALLDKMLTSDQSYLLNCGYGRGLSVRQVLDAVTRLSGGGLKVSNGKRRPGDAAEIVADVGRLHQVLDWRPQHGDLDHIIETALSWERRLSGAMD